MKIRFLIIPILTIIVLVISCSDSEMPAQTDIIKCSQSKIVHSTSEIDIKGDSIKIIIDNSVSMAGFNENSGMSVYSLFLQELLSIPLGDYKKAFYRTNGISFAPIKHSDVWDASLGDNFYYETQTKLGDLAYFISHMEDSQLSAAYIIVTDGVISTRESEFGGKLNDYTLIVNSIKSWMEERNFTFNIIAVRSQFDGLAFSELNKFTSRGKHRLNSYKSWAEQDSTFRPFYIYVFSPNKQTANEITNTLTGLNAIRNLSYLLNFQPYITEVAQYNFKVPARISGKWKNPFKLRKFPNSKYPNIIYLQWNPKESESFNSGHIKIDFNAIISSASKEYLKNLGLYILTPETYYFEGPNKILSVSAEGKIRYKFVPSALAKKSEDDSSIEISIEIDIVPHDKAGWYVYHFIIYPDPNAIDVPSWVDNWSTESDSKLSSYNRTFNLESLIRGLLRNKQILGQSIGEFYVVLEKRS